MCESSLTRAITRRRMITRGATALTLAASLPVASIANAQEKDEAPVSPAAALQRLLDGNARYVTNTEINTDHSAGRPQRALGQKPFAAIVSCADSRVAPELIFDQGPGELFIVRVAGNFISEEGLASLEYGAAVLGIQAILVLGHSSCGAVTSAIESVKNGTELPGHMPSLVEAIRPAVESVEGADPNDMVARVTAENARQNAVRARTAKPILAELRQSGKLGTAGGVYDIATGKVTFL